MEAGQAKQETAYLTSTQDLMTVQLLAIAAVASPPLLTAAPPPRKVP